jgi:hypothetical protein
MEDDAHQPGEELGRAWSHDDLAARPLGEAQCTAGPGPEADQAAQRPKVDQQDQGVGLAADRRDQVFLNDVQLAADHPAQRDSYEERTHDFPGGKGEDDGDGWRQDRPEAVVVSVLWEVPGRGQRRDEE